MRSKRHQGSCSMTQLIRTYEQGEAIEDRAPFVSPHRGAVIWTNKFDLLSPNPDGLVLGNVIVQNKNHARPAQLLNLNRLFS
jgi:hypothetical protein